VGEGELPERPEPDEAGPESSALRREELDEVLAAMRELPAHYRAALALRHLQELSYQEVADTLGIPLGTVKTHLHRARAALKSRLAARRRERES
jgi:RNA polymerase sigma-70 factor (ECF subfamily)